MAQKENTVMASIIFASVALLYTASTVNARIGSDNSISCSTSDSSPYLEHAEETVNAIRKLPEDQQCCQLRDPSGCTEMASWFTSKVNICGKKGCTTCRKAGEALNQVLAQCPRRDSNDQTRVEGTNEVDGFTVNIYRGDVLTSDDSSVKCSTSDSSPFLANAEETVNAIRKLPEDQQCCQLRDPSGCTEMASWFTSKVNICGKKGCTTCRKAGEALNQVLAQCPRRDSNDQTRVEGTNEVDGFTVNIYRGDVLTSDDSSVKCSTSDSSPFLANAEETVNAIRKLPEDQQCCQLRDPSGCTEMASWFTSKVNICGKKGCTTCRKAGEALNQVLAQCPRRDSNDQTRVEGTNEVDGFTVNIYRGDVLTSDDSSVKCSTSDSSPFLANAETTVNAIRKLPEDQQCCQLKEPSGCTEMAAWLTSKVDICGEKGCTTCRKAGEALNQVLAQCPKRDTNDETRVEGEIKEDGFTFKIALNVLDTGKIKLAEYV